MFQHITQKQNLDLKNLVITFENISGLDLNYTYYRSDRMSNMIGAHGGAQQVYKFSDTNLGLYYNFESLN